jgi:sugar lactone lactonase YvrE/ABC-type oligopeptide transport system ATPase subunit
MNNLNSEKNVHQNSEPGKLGNPFPGLRPFSIEESHLFFGREGQSEEVLQHLSENRFVAVIGASGSGKSSLMYCGLVPILHGGFIAEAGSDWKIITTRPGNQPTDNLAISLTDSYNSGEDAVDYEKNLGMIQAILRRSSLGLAEAVAQLEPDRQSNILLMVDQFEELFRFKKSRRDEIGFNESEAYVKLLVSAVRQKDIPVYVVLTMRSDFIGECSQFQELTRLINESNYLIPQMTRDDFRSAITGPVAVGGAQIDPNLVQQLLNDVGDNPDQLPILQHALMRTWDYWIEQGDLSRPVSISDYDAVGRMEKALSEHANEAFEELSPHEKQICESMFKTLTEKGGDVVGIRQPTKLNIIAEIARTGNDELIRVIDIFRAPGRSFLMPAYHQKLTDDTVIDISHESLMRIWDRLKVWVDEEAQAVEMYNRLADASGLFQDGKTGLWRPPDLTLALNWQKKQQPTLTWATRYNPAFERAMVFLETSEKEYIAEEENKIRLQKRQLQRTRIFAIVLGTAAVISIGIMLYAFVLREQAVKAQNEAEVQRAKADSNATIAGIERQRALDALDEAERQRIIADSNATLAIYRQMLADSSAEVANQQRRIALINEAMASAQADTAEQRRVEAETQRKLAEEASQEAYRRRLLSIAQSMAVKSLQVDNDTNLKALLSYQAYIFNQNYGGSEHHNDIYAGLYDAVGFLRGPSWNIFKGHDDAVRSIVFIPGTNIFFTTGSDGKILKWQLDDKQSSLVIENNMVNRIIDVTDDGKWLACGTDGMGIQIFNINSPTGEPRMFNSTDNRIRALDFLPDNNRMVSGGTGNEILMWNLSNGNSQQFATVTSPVQVLTVSADGNWLACGTRNGQIIIWELSDPSNQYLLFEERGNQVLALSYSPDGKWLASGDLRGNVKIWDTQKKTLVDNLRGHRARITDLKFSPDGDILASASNDGSVRLWETADLNNQPIVLTGNSGFVFSLAFSPDGSYILTGSTEANRLLASPTKAKYLAEQICTRIDRNMSAEEWSTYVGADIPYEETCGSKFSIGIKNE